MEQKIAKYYRLSREDIDMKSNTRKDESNSIHSQRLLCERFILANKDLSQMQCEEFIDDGFSGTNFNRPEFQRMMKLIKSGDIQCVIVKDLSRFGREYLQVGDFLEHVFPFLGVRFISINDHYDSNQYMGTTGGIEIAFRNLISEKYSYDLSLRVKSAMHLKMSKGTYINNCPYGYTKKPGIKHKMFIDPETAPIVRRIFLDIISGKKTTEIATELNKQNVPTPMQHKNLTRKNLENIVMWSHYAVLRIIQDYKYTGAMINFKCENQTIRAKTQAKISKDKWVIVENQHEAIVTHEEFEFANEQIRKVKKGNVVRTDQRDRIYYCGHCGRKLRKTFGADEYFSCCTQLYLEKCKCADIFWSKTDLESLLMEIFRSQLLILTEKENKPEADFKSTLKEYVNLAKQISREIENCDEKKIQQYEAYKEGKVNKTIFLEQKKNLITCKNEFQHQLEEIEDKIQKVKFAQLQQNQKDKTQQTAAQTLSLPMEELREEMLNSIERVVVYSNSELEIQWKEKDLFSTLKLQCKEK